MPKVAAPSSHIPGLGQISGTSVGEILRDDPPISHPCEISSPVGLPALICLYGRSRPDARETPLYLCDPTSLVRSL